jgi:hypothetical protein
MGATSDNYNIVTSGTTYTIASSFVNDAHHQRVQIVYGASGSAIDVTASNGLPVTLVNSQVGISYTSPLTVDISTATIGNLPVQVTSFANTSPLQVSIAGATGISLSFATGTTLNVTIDGALERYDYTSNSGYYSIATTIMGLGASMDYMPVTGASGAVPIGVTMGQVTVNADNLNIRKLQGGGIGGTSDIAAIDYVSIQGICSGYPVGITVSQPLPVTVSSFSNLGVFGVAGATAVGVTFGTVITRGLTAASDTITVYGGGTASTVSVGLFGFTGATAAPIFSENNALNVNIKSSLGLTVSGASLDIRSVDYTRDTITVVGQGATDTQSKSTVPTYMNTILSNGNMERVGGFTGAGWSGSAVSVYLVNTGISFNAYATFSTGIGISQEAYNPVPVKGSTSSTVGVWVVGDTGNGPVIVKGFSGGLLPVELPNIDTSLSSLSSTLNTSLSNIKNGTDYMAALKAALYSQNVSVGSTDFRYTESLYALVKAAIDNNIVPVSESVLTNAVVENVNVATQKSIGVSLLSVKQQPTFMSRTGFVGYAAKNLSELNSAPGFTCSTGVRIKTSRVATGASASSNEFMCVISAQDTNTYGLTATSAAYTLYHGEEMFIEVDNINKVYVFYPPYSASTAPHNTGPGLTFSFYAS